MSSLTEYLISFFLLAGAAFALIGSIGLMRLPDFYLRLHGPAKATTLGVGGIIIGSVIFFSTQGEGLSLHELLIALFLFITAPVSAGSHACRSRSAVISATGPGRMLQRISRVSGSSSKRNWDTACFSATGTGIGARRL